jgi:hypothetical protein
MKRLARLLLIGSWGAACAPPPSNVPLGLGPLAIAEADAQDAAARARASSRPERASPPPSSVKATSEKKAPSDEETTASPVTAEADDDVREPAETGTPSSEAPAFDGLFAGEDVAIFRLSGFPDREQKDPKAQIRLKKDSESQVRITLINSENGSDLCELVARVEGNAALLESPQPCFTSEEEGAIQAELTSGRAVVEGDRLTMEAKGTLFVELADQEIPGALEYSFEGRRQ